MTHRIYLKDTNPPFNKMTYSDAHKAMLDAGQWAKENCKSFVSFGVQEMSDMDSAACDWMGEYVFTSKKDVTLFTLKWG